MPAIIGAALLLIGSVLGGGSLPFGERLIKETSGQPEGFFCLDKIPDKEPTLLAIPKPEVDPNWMGSEGCQLQSCPGDYETANYIQVTSGVILPRIWPDTQTTRLLKQSNGIPEELKDRVYRPSCNDWCYLCQDLDEFDPSCPRSGFLPYGGSFHCDFIWLLQENEPMREINGELYPDDRACDLEADPANKEHNCPVFDIYIREGAEIPPVAKCRREKRSFLKNTGGKVFAQTESFLNLLGKRWMLAHDSENEPKRLVKWDLRTEGEGRVLITNEKVEPLEVSFRGGNYHAYQNLTSKVDLKYGDRYLYLVESWYEERDSRFKDYVMMADEYPAHQYYVFPYLELRSTKELKPEAKSLQLGTFIPSVGKLRWHWWTDESKPAIYLYPEEPTALRVKLNPAGELTVSDPPYDPEKGWEVVAYPDGKIREYESHETYESHKTYGYLFYEAKLTKVYVEPKGFVVKGADLVSFFKKELPRWGLNEKETADFIDYWMGRLDKNQPYYFIHFLDNEQIEALEPLVVAQLAEPQGTEDYGTVNADQGRPLQPETSIRIRTYFEPLNSPKELGEITPQSPPAIPPRQGFTLVEWGGILVNSQP